MKNKISSLICFQVLAILIGTSAIAQTRTLTMEDVVLSARRGLVPAKLDQLQWIPKSSSFSYVTHEPTGDALVSGSSSGKETKEIVTVPKLNLSLKVIGKDTVAAMPVIKWISSDQFMFPISEKTYSYSLKTKTSSLLLEAPGENAENKEVNPAYNAMAYTIDNNLWVVTADKRIPVTNDTLPGIINGQKVHREEFGIHKGTFWSPSGKLLAFYRMDQSMVTDYPIIDLATQPAGVKMIKYPMAGGKSHHVTIGIYSMLTGKTIFLNTGEPAEQYLTNISWSPDEKKLLVAVLNRAQNHLKLNSYDAGTGMFEATLFEEKDPNYVQPLYPALFKKDGSAFIWQSRRDGYNHLYLYDNSGKLLQQVTQGKWEVTECLGFTAAEDKVCYISNAESPINRDIFAVTLKNGAVKKLSTEGGVHKAIMNTSGEFFMDELSAPGIPKSIRILNGNGILQKQLLNSENPLKNFVPVKREVFTITNETGDLLFCRMLKPATFDSTKMYPVIVYVYGGPGINLISNNWTYGADLWQHYMAQRGFIVFTLENRGTPNRGKDFEQATFRKLGDVEMQDQIAGVKFLMNQRYIDKNRMGVYGWSYGGFMSVSLMTRNPGTFTVGVAGGPVIDWSQYEVMYTERYMDTPEENPEGYKKSNLLNYVDKLKGNMLLIHGTSDDTVVWQQSLTYLKKAVEKNIQLDYFVYPGHGHNVTGPDRIHLLNKVSDYFFEHLQ